MTRVPQRIFQPRLLELLYYNKETGEFFYRKSRGKMRAGARAGCVGVRQRLLCVDRILFPEHRLAWLYVTGEWPVTVDHKNGDPYDNRFKNLRAANWYQQRANSLSTTRKLKGAYEDKNALGKWRSRIRIAGKTLELGRFNTENEAHECYMAELRRVAGEFAFNGRTGCR